ncbi:MAG: hypothetical protein AAFX99_37330, partial [Myxococcota bacterium]
TLSRLTPFAAVLCVALAWTGCGDLEEDGASCDPSAEADCVCSMAAEQPLQVNRVEDRTMDVYVP